MAVRVKPTQATRKAIKAAKAGGGPQGPIIVGGYKRLSEDRHGDKIGYEVQHNPIERFCEMKGYQVVWYEDRDLTAADRSVVRPAYEQMLQDLQDGKINGVVVWRLDRLVRLAREFERCFGIVEDAGGFIVDVDQGFTTSTPTGKLIMRILVMVAEMEVTGMRIRQTAHQRNKAEKGEHHGGGHRAFGFEGAIRDEEDKIINQGFIGVRHVPHEIELLREAGRRVAHDGESYSDVIRDWASRDPPVLGTNGRPFTVGSLAEILTSPRAGGYRVTQEVNEKTGEVKTEFHKAKWEPVLDEATWRKLCDARKSRPEGNKPAADYLMGGGLAVCGKSDCGGKMVGAQRRLYRKRVPGWQNQKAQTVPEYRCGTCYGCAATASDVEFTALSELFARLKRSPHIFDVIAARKSDIGSEAHAEMNAAVALVAWADGELATLTQQKYLPPNHPDRLQELEYRVARDQVIELKAGAEATIRRLSASQSFPVPRGSDRENLEEWFEGLTLAQRQAFLRAHLRRVVVLPARRGVRQFEKSRVVPVFADAEEVGGSGDHRGVSDLDGDALLRTDAVDVGLGVSGEVLRNETHTVTLKARSTGSRSTSRKKPTKK